jgi:hypothetical protein
LSAYFAEIIQDEAESFGGTIPSWLEMDESFSAQSGLNRSTDSKSGSTEQKENKKVPTSVSPNVNVSGIHSIS